MDGVAAPALASTHAPVAGLSAAAASALRARDGPNVLPHPGRRSPVQPLVAPWTHFFAVLLWVAAALAVVAGMPQLAVAITVLVLRAGDRVCADAVDQHAPR